MKTIKELVKDVAIEGDSLFKSGYYKALKDVLGLIDELPDWIETYCEKCKTKAIISFPDKEELKARIKG